MLICTARAYEDVLSEGLEPLTACLIKRIASFLAIEIRRSDAIFIIAQHIHQRCAAFAADFSPISDYNTILNEVYFHDPIDQN